MRLTPPSSPSIAPDLRCRLPGGMHGEVYDGVIDAPPGHEVYSAQVPPESGLSATEHNPARLQGALRSTAPILVRVVLRNLATHILCPAEAIIHVVANPKALYASLPADPNAIGAKPERQSMEAGAGQWGMVGASIRGRAHANVGGQREDDVQVRAVSQQRMAFAISDGAGSARLAALASAIAVQQSIDVLASPLAAQDPAASLSAAARAAYAGIARAADQHAAPLDDFGCTLTLGVYQPPSQEGAAASLALWQIGDGIVMAESDGRIRILLAGDHGEYAGQTRFLHHLGEEPSLFYSRVQCFDVARVSWIVACTDGISDPFALDMLDLEGQTSALANCAPFAKILHTARAVVSKTATIEQLYEAMAVFTPGSHDDRSLVCITAAGIQ